MVRRPGLQTVELQDDTPPRDAPASVLPGDGSARAPSAEPQRHRASRGGLLLAGAAVIAAVGLAVVQVLVDSRARASEEAWAELPGAIDPLGGDLAVGWTMDPSFVAGLVQWPPGTGALVAAALADDGSVHAVSVDLATGVERWRMPLLPADGGRSAAGEQRAPAVSCAMGAAADLVACLLPDDGADAADLGDQRSDGGGAGRAGSDRPSASTRLVVLDTASGEQVLDTRVPAASSVALAGSTAVVAGTDGGTVVVRALDARTGAPRWVHQHPLPGTAAPDPAGATREDVRVTAGGGVVGVLDRDGAMTVLEATNGAVRRRFGAGGYGLDTQRIGTGDVAVYTASHGGEDTTVLMRGGFPDLQLRGTLLPTVVDDGSVPGLVLTSTAAGLVAWDLDTGAERWRAERFASGGAALLAGVLYLSTSDREVLALDARDGHDRWGAPVVEGRDGAAVVTDGHRLYAVTERLAASQRGMRVAQVGVYTFDGAHLRSLAVPEGVAGLAVVGRTLVGWSEHADTLVVLR